MDYTDGVILESLRRICEGERDITLKCVPKLLLVQSIYMLAMESSVLVFLTKRNEHELWEYDDDDRKVHSTFF